MDEFPDSRNEDYSSGWNPWCRLYYDVGRRVDIEPGAVIAGCGCGYVDMDVYLDEEERDRVLNLSPDCQLTVVGCHPVRKEYKDDFDRYWSLLGELIRSEEYKEYERACDRLGEMKDNNPYKSREEEIKDNRIIECQRRLDEIEKDIDILSYKASKGIVLENRNRSFILNEKESVQQETIDMEKRNTYGTYIPMIIISGITIAMLNKAIPSMETVKQTYLFQKVFASRNEYIMTILSVVILLCRSVKRREA